MELFNSGYEAVEVVERRDLFGGLFATTYEQETHGPIVNVFEIDDEMILSNYHLNYEMDYEQVKAAFAAVVRKERLQIDEDSEEWDAIWTNVVEDKSGPNDVETLMALADTEDWGDASWYAQKLRGMLCEQLGFKVVEMKDEHGTSYLIAPGVKSSPKF